MEDNGLLVPEVLLVLGVLAGVAGLIWFLRWMTLSPSGAAWEARHLAAETQRRQDRVASAAVPEATCPTCQASTVERVTIGTRAVSGVAGGLVFSRKARAQFHCRSCNYYW